MDLRQEGIMDLSAIISGCFGVVPNLLALPKERRELRDNALRGILVALDETFLYYRDIERGSQRDLDREALLVRYWSAAAIPMSRVDPGLARRCDQKAEYWLNPKRYESDEVIELGIELESVRSAYRNLLAPKGLARRRNTVARREPRF
ncbi:hypothetical protein JLK41_03805 [Ectopseudomonas khazarica]|uniref:hypothetical protein n=1 Tax=Ectopseudomonas khazarica TaxID=2502979 RepID=UPI001AEF8A1C|nr:hypothetical protein [Pseudomonas khazarica]QTS87308.1 hypothetical protein JLK41_03805 [Pseudomonas khazarica]